ncbi:hypothetical protein TNCV_3198671 [Trichonephila clavipes]|nr:hypothetical protein TNCV_3198671 [Trichonephila clavipes]
MRGQKTIYLSPIHCRTFEQDADNLRLRPDLIGAPYFLQRIRNLDWTSILGVSAFGENQDVLPYFRKYDHYGSEGVMIWSGSYHFRIQLVDDYLVSESIYGLDLQTRSPYLNTVEHVWMVLRLQLHLAIHLREPSLS